MFPFPEICTNFKTTFALNKQLKSSSWEKKKNVREISKNIIAICRVAMREWMIRDLQCKHPTITCQPGAACSCFPSVSTLAVGLWGVSAGGDGQLGKVLPCVIGTEEKCLRAYPRNNLEGVLWVFLQSELREAYLWFFSFNFCCVCGLRVQPKQTCQGKSQCWKHFVSLLPNGLNGRVTALKLLWDRKFPVPLQSPVSELNVLQVLWIVPCGLTAKPSW